MTTAQPPPPAENPQAPPPPVHGAVFCRNCGRQIEATSVFCAACRAQQSPVQPVEAPPQPAAVYVPPALPQPKSAGLAIFFSFLWPGAGHLYVGGDNEKGIIFTCISGLCFLISWTIIGLVVTIPVWFATAIYTMIDSNKLAQRRNAAMGFPEFAG
jgi:TM2 domain-containing membrane protein YozV